MTEDDYPYQFTAPVTCRRLGSFTFHVVYLPAALVRRLPLQGKTRLRIEGEMEGIRVEAAIMPAKGQWYVMTSRKLLKLCGLQVGSQAHVQFDIADPAAVSVPRELRYALDADEAALDVWERLTPGKKRGLAYHVDSAKRSETREKRAEYVIEQLKDVGPTDDP